jgi:hypothetical protein
MKNNRREVEAKKAIEKAKAAVKAGEQKLVEARENRTIECAHCLKRSRVTTWQVFQKMWYEGPHGCIDGACWHFGEQGILCPKCGVWNRLILNVGERIAKRYTRLMPKADPPKGDEIPGDWVNL